MTRFRLLLVLAGGIAFTLLTWTVAEKNAQRQISDIISYTGLSAASIDTISFGPFKTKAEGIALDNKAIDTIESIETGKGWFSFFSRSDNVDITINKPDIYRHVAHGNALLPALLAIQPHLLTGLPNGHLKINDGRINLSTPLGDFQFLFDIIINPTKDDGKRTVIATLESHQNTLDFVSEWNGQIDQNGLLLIDTTIPEIKATIASFRLLRGNGWLSLSNAGRYPAISGQIESGAANLGTFPLQDFNLAVNIAHQDISLIARSQPNGVSEGSLSLDVGLTEDTQHAMLTLSAADPGDLINYVEKALGRPLPTLSSTLTKKSDVMLQLAYQPSKRFASGPYPFDISAMLEHISIVQGAFLIYPDTLDMRGSSQISRAYIQALQNDLKIPGKLINGDHIRIEGSLSSLLSRIGAGIVNDTGE
jgi:hypothetical protein